MTIIPVVAVVLAVVAYFALMEESGQIDAVKILAEACRIKEAEQLKEEVYVEEDHFKSFNNKNQERLSLATQRLLSMDMRV